MTDNKFSNFIPLLNGNQLKFLALISMTLDHVGKELLPQYPVLQILGRLAFPIFAYMIAEGCYYTKNRKKYLLNIACVALLCQIVYFLVEGSLYQCILVTFSLSICMIYAMDYAKKKRTLFAGTLAVCTCLLIAFLSFFLPGLLPNTDFSIDYGLLGILTPVFIYYGKTKYRKLLFAAIPLICLCIEFGSIQWYSLFALIPLALYNNQRGKMKLKYLFYIYYPLHLACIYLIGII